MRNLHKIALCGKLTPDVKQMFRDAFSARCEIVEIADDSQLSLALDAEYIVTRGVKFPAERIASLGENVRLIHRWGVGYDSVDIDAAAQRGIPVAVCTGGNAQPVAEMAVLLMLASNRNLTALLDRAREGTGNREDIIARSYLLQDKTVGLIGLGNIGSRVAGMVQAFGARVIYYDAFRASAEQEQRLGVTFVPLDELLAASDIVSVHVPLMDATHHMLGAPQFAMMKPGALLVNTARGGIVDTQAMLDALDAGTLRAAALDTVEGEPLPADHPIFSRSDVLLTPHGAGNTCDNNANMFDIIRRNIDAMENGTMPEARYVVNLRSLSR